MVNKSVWADIGATCACSANRRRDTEILQLKKFRGFFKCLQRQDIGANWFAAPIYWRSTRRIKMFAAPRLFGQMMPIQSAGVTEVEIDLFQDGGQIKIKMNVAHHNGS